MNMKWALGLITAATALVVFLLGGLTYLQEGSEVSCCPCDEDIQDLLLALEDAIHGRQEATPEFLQRIHGALSGAKSGNRSHPGSGKLPRSESGPGSNSENTYGSNFEIRSGSNSANGSRVVCPERYLGPMDKSLSKWVTETCDYALPVAELVTVILLDAQNHSLLQGVAESVQKSLSGVAVLAPLGAKEPKPDAGAVTYVRTSPNATSGETWNALIDSCSTPYAFLATVGLNVSLDLPALQRLLRVLTETDGVQVVGGATRNATGHWRAACYQVVLKNYVLRYLKGYHESYKDCMLCDHVDAPFLAATTLLKSAPMDRKLPAVMLVPDFFLRVFRSQRSLLCPDVMFDGDGLLTSPLARNRRLWKALAAKWQLNRIQIKFPRSTVLHKFNCSEAGLKKCNTENGTRALPVCCQEEFGRIIAFWAGFAAEHGINYQFHSGSALGAVKMEDLLPWDIDGDIFFDVANYSFVRDSVAVFRSVGVLLLNIKAPTEGFDVESWGYMQMMFSGFYIELYVVPLSMPSSVEEIFPDDAAPPGINPFNVTRVELHGAWVTAPPNPGLYARGRYGKDLLKHALNWRHSSKKTSWEPYDSAGHFTNACKDPSHHACLSAMPADGSIFYNVPE